MKTPPKKLARNRRWRMENRAHLAAYRRAWRKSHRQAVKAHRLLQKAVRLHLLKRPEKCEECGEPARTHGHHEDYAKPLQVEWLCEACHAGRRVQN